MNILIPFVLQCPACKTIVSPLVHDYSLCSQLKNAEYRIRELEKTVAELKQNVG